MFTVIYGRLLNLALQADIEVFVRDFIESHGGVAAQIGYEGYKYATCCSINDEICHGFPRKSIKRWRPNQSRYVCRLKGRNF